MKTRASATSSVKLKCESSALGVQANDQALRGMFFTEPALLNRQLLSDLLRPLAGLSFRLGVAAGLASVAVVGDDDFRKPFAQRTPRTSPTRPSRQSPPFYSWLLHSCTPRTHRATCRHVVLPLNYNFHDCGGSLKHGPAVFTHRPAAYDGLHAHTHTHIDIGRVLFRRVLNRFTPII